MKVEIDDPGKLAAGMKPHLQKWVQNIAERSAESRCAEMFAEAKHDILHEAQAILDAKNEGCTLEALESLPEAYKNGLREVGHQVRKEAVMMFPPNGWACSSSIGVSNTGTMKITLYITPLVKNG